MNHSNNRRLLSGVPFPGGLIGGTGGTENPQIGLLALGKHHALVGSLGGADGSDTFTFTLSQPTQVTLSLTGLSQDANLYLTRGKKIIGASINPGTAGETLVRSLTTGTYGVTVEGRSRASTNYQLSLATANVAAPSRLEADVWGGNSVHLNWNDNTVGESGYLIQRYTHKGWRNVKTVAANSTAAVVDGLTPGTASTYRVSAIGIHLPPPKPGHRSVMTVSGVTAMGTNTVMAMTGSQDTSGWYKINITQAMTHAYAGWSTQSDGLAVLPQYQNQWLYAGSWQAAVWTAVSGQAQVYVTDYEAGHTPGQIITHNFPSGGDFKVGTGAEIAASATNFKLPHTVADAGADTKYIALEDSYGQIDRDYDDFYWTVATQFKPEVTLTADKAQVDEGDSNRIITYTVARTGQPIGDLNVQLGWSGTASSGSDYNGQQYSVLIPDGQSSKSFSISVTDDSNLEWAESIIGKVTPNDAEYGTRQTEADAEIVDNDRIKLSYSGIEDADKNSSGTLLFVGQDRQEIDFTVPQAAKSGASLSVSADGPGQVHFYDSATSTTPLSSLTWNAGSMPSQIFVGADTPGEFDLTLTANDVSTLPAATQLPVRKDNAKGNGIDIQTTSVTGINDLWYFNGGEATNYDKTLNYGVVGLQGKALLYTFDWNVSSGQPQIELSDNNTAGLKALDSGDEIKGISRDAVKATSTSKSSTLNDVTVSVTVSRAKVPPVTKTKQLTVLALEVITQQGPPVDEVSSGTKFKTTYYWIILD